MIVWFDGQIVCSKIERLSNVDEIKVQDTYLSIAIDLILKTFSRLVFMQI